MCLASGGSYFIESHKFRNFAERRKFMADGNHRTSPRVNLIRLIPDTTPSHPRSEKRMDAVKFAQKEKVAKHLIGKFAGEPVAIICDDLSQCAAFSPSPTPAENVGRNLQSFLSGTTQLLATTSILDDDFEPGFPTNVFLLASRFSQFKLSECLSAMIINKQVTLFIIFHAFTQEDWNIGEVISDFNPDLISLSNITVQDEAEDEQPTDEAEFDRMKAYTLPYGKGMATYKFMWNDGYNSVYHTISQNGRTIHDGYCYWADLLELLNRDFNNTTPSETLVRYINDKLNCEWEGIG